MTTATKRGNTYEGPRARPATKANTQHGHALELARLTAETPHRCEGCGRNYAEYVNGCVEDHPAPRKVVAVPTPPDV